MAYDILANGKDPADMDIAFDSGPVKEYIKERCDKFGITVPSDYTAIQ